MLGPLSQGHSPRRQLWCRSRAGRCASERFSEERTVRNVELSSQLIKDHFLWRRVLPLLVIVTFVAVVANVPKVALAILVGVDFAVLIIAAYRRAGSD